MATPCLVLEAALLAGLGAWYLVAVPESDVTDAATGLPAGGYAKAIGAGALVVAVVLALLAWLIARRASWGAGFALCWQVFQAVAGVTLLGEPDLSAGAVAAGIALVVLALAAGVTCVSFFVATRRANPWQPQ